MKKRILIMLGIAIAIFLYFGLGGKKMVLGPCKCIGVLGYKPEFPEVMCYGIVRCGLYDE